MALVNKKTPESLRAACNQFIYLEILSQNKIAESPEVKPDTETKTANTTANEDTAITPVIKKTPQQLASDAKLVSLIRSAIESLSDEEGFANTGEVKKHIVKNYSAFDSRNYGYPKFSDLINTIGLFELDAKKQRIKDKRKNK
jgi:hypothetical protein